MCEKELAKNVLNNPTRALDITANLATAAVSKNPENVLKIKNTATSDQFLSYRQGFELA